ncbi:hypothetical protein KFZ58_09455 [Virgibacillus sp. NKC19-16]|uniref:YqfQ family protein n=1 Tax=Virgibacillus salidurans TaxID=2831673 RepID=UPI001F47B14C|nr:YqfQ family protein [Virgibacillus sp. NKC19-16]UJL48051.1 hypothetical protein KFZ58_09455 [Virgibacillus sp. NKC19-16]
MVFPLQQPRNPYPDHRAHAVNNPLLPKQRLNAPANSNNIKSLLQNQSTAGLVNKGIGGLSGALNNVQHVLNVVQSTAPIVQEYGPMVKNLPAMYRMMKAFKEVDSSDDVEKEQNHSNEKENVANNDKNYDEIKQPTSDNKYSETKKDNGLSTPKLFI